MPFFNRADERAAAVLSALRLAPASHAASGRYLRSMPFRPGVRYWASSQPRIRQDMFGVQFYGEGCREAERIGAALEHGGFKRRNPQSGQDTYAKPIPFASADEVDFSALRRAKFELDALLGGAGEAVSVPFKTVRLREFMLRSPLSELQLPDPDRQGGWRGPAV